MFNLLYGLFLVNTNKQNKYKAIEIWKHACIGNHP